MMRAGLSRREMVWLTVGVVISLVVHWTFAITDGFGEPDAAKLGIQACVWSKTGELLNIGYTVRTSPLYIHAIKLAMDAGMPAAMVPAAMSCTNVVLGSLLLVPLYLLWRRLVSASVACLSLVIYSFMPAFWLGNIYGMPHLPAFFFFVFGLWCFCRGIEWSGLLAWVWFAVSVLFIAIGIGFKADIVLCCGAFLWFAVRQKPVAIRNVVVACVTPLIAVMAIMWYTCLISPKHISTSQWTGSFPFTIHALISLENDAAVVMACGIVLSVIILACVLYSAIRRQQVGLLLLAAMWLLPVAIFWCPRPGNIARHMMAGYAPLALIVAAIMGHVLADRRLLWTAAVVILAANYFVSPGFSLPRTARPGSRLLDARNHIHARVDNWHKTGLAFAELPDRRKMLLGPDYLFYGLWETLISAKTFAHADGWSVVGANGPQDVRFVYLPADRPVPQVEAGWSAWRWQDDGRQSSISKVDAP